MTVGACLNLVDSICPTTAGDEVKMRFLREIEGRVRVELLGKTPDELILNVDTELTVPSPYDSLYWLYLMAMMYFVEGDAEAYERCAALFNAAYRDYGKWLKRTGV